MCFQIEDTVSPENKIRQFLNPIRPQMLNFGADQKPLQFDGYFGPFNRTTHTGTMKKQQNLIAVKNQEASKNVFGGLSAAGPLATDAHSQNAMLARIRILRKAQNISPHAYLTR